MRGDVFNEQLLHLIVDETMAALGDEAAVAAEGDLTVRMFDEMVAAWAKAAHNVLDDAVNDGYIYKDEADILKMPLNQHAGFRQLPRFSSSAAW